MQKRLSFSVQMWVAFLSLYHCRLNIFDQITIYSNCQFSDAILESEKALFTIFSDKQLVCTTMLQDMCSAIELALSSRQIVLDPCSSPLLLSMC